MQEAVTTTAIRATILIVFMGSLLVAGLPHTAKGDRD
jgi:hypothetical protein